MKTLVMTAEAEIMIYIDGPDIGEAHNVLKSATDLNFKNFFSLKHFPDTRKDSTRSVVL